MMMIEGMETETNVEEEEEEGPVWLTLLELWTRGRHVHGSGSVE